MGFSTAVCNALLDHYFGKSVLTAPANLYVALADSGGTEPSSGGYARVQTAPADWNTAAALEITNANAVTLPAPTGDWGTMTQAKLFVAASGGTAVASGDLTEPIEVLSGGTTPEFVAGSIHVKFI